MQDMTRSRSHRQACGGCRVAADVDRSRGSLARRVEHLRLKKAKNTGKHNTRVTTRAKHEFTTECSFEIVDGRAREER